MALKRVNIEGYGQLELNQVAFRRDGRIEAQCKLNETDFADMPAENGMILAVDNVAREIKLPVENEELPLALVYSTEHMYDERALGLKNFANFIPGKNSLNTNPFLPRLGYLAVGDKFCTNTLCYDDGEYASEDALMTALEGIDNARLYGKYTTTGAIQITATKPTAGPVILVTKKFTMPSGVFGLKLQVIG